MSLHGSFEFEDVKYDIILQLDLEPAIVFIKEYNAKGLTEWTEVNLNSNRIKETEDDNVLQDSGIVDSHFILGDPDEAVPKQTISEMLSLKIFEAQSCVTSLIFGFGIKKVDDNHSICQNRNWVKSAVSCIEILLMKKLE